MALGDLTSLANVKAWVYSATNQDAGNSDPILSRLITQVSATILGELQRPTLLSRVYTDLSDGFDSPAEYLDNWPVTAVSQVAVDSLVIPAAPLLAVSPVTTTSYGYRLQPWDGFSAGGPQAVELIGARFRRGKLNVSITYTAGYLVQDEARTVPASPYKITANAILGPWAEDAGVTYANGTALTPVSGSPDVGQYAVADGVYIFAAADTLASVLLSYSFVPNALEDACINWVAERFRYRTRIGMRSQSMGGQESTAYDLSAIPAYVAAALQPYKKVLPI